MDASSESRLVNVQPALVRVVHRADTACPGLFIVSEGVRSDADQLRDWMRHASKLNGIPVGQVVNGVHGTGRGNHQLNLVDKLGHAVDLAPMIGGLVWGGPSATSAQQWIGCCAVADAMRDAAIAEAIRIRWGGDWDAALNDLPDGATALMIDHNSYMSKFRAANGRWPLADGPHFELK
jgi:hypothetical protein